MRPHIRHLKHVGVLITAGALLTGVMSSPASAAPAPARAAARAKSTITVDDATTRGTNRFTYNGEWRVCKHCDKAAKNRSFHYSSRAGSTVTLKFTGTRATIYGFREKAGGAAAVAVDGRFVGVVSFKARHRTYDDIYTTRTLRNGRHTVTLKVLRRPSGAGKTISVDKAVIVQRTAAGQRPVPDGSPGRPGTRPSPPETTPPTRGAGIASLTFDDGKISQYNNVRPKLKSAGVKATFYIISDALTWGRSSMSAKQVHDLSDDGNEIGNHTTSHEDLTKLSADAAEAQLAAANKAIKEKVGVEPTTCAYPYGKSNDAVRKIAENRFAGCRGTGGGTNQASSLNAYDLRTYYVKTSTTAAQVEKAASDAKASGAWLIFVYHGVGTVSTSDDVTEDSFTAQFKAIRKTGISIRTVSETLKAMG